MNIKEAKEQIKNAITAYFTKDNFGNYIIPIEKQRPIFLMGAPGIGKTAIMEHDSSYQTKCIGTTIHREKNIWWAGIQRV